MEAGTNLVRPIRRECYCAARSCGYGPSSAYTMAGYASPDRISASRNAQRLERHDICRDRIAYLTSHPDVAMKAMATAQAVLGKQIGRDRNRALKAVLDGRKLAKSSREVLAPIAPPQTSDNESLVELLELILDEARALVDRCRLDGADTIVTKSAIDLHRSATSARERFLNIANEADNKSNITVIEGDISAVKMHINMQRQIGDLPEQLPDLDVQPKTTVAETRDEEHLRYNIAVSLEQIDNLSIGKIPAIKDHIRLYETLLKSVVKLSQIISRRSVDTQKTLTSPNFFFDPKVFLRWAKMNNISQ